ncbi:MAG: deoxyribose-phosphate aldolase [Elusimicrobiota bacterium]|jgi:deoxyribose-phosphate aldolase|nr:deoxyribose-phosphate aldolase [Elusimicrobiota bacterium]
MIANIASYIDFTLLKPNAKVADYTKLCSDAAANKFYSVCVPPFMVKSCKEMLDSSEVKITTVIGFPLGYSTPEIKASEAAFAIKQGADDIDMVINISEAKSGNFDYLKKELVMVREATQNKTLKVIIETCYLSKEEIAKISRLVSDCKADFVKTSTGFGPAGALLEDIAIIKSAIRPETKIKAAGGIRTYADAEAFVNAGASRIGSSAIIVSPKA